MNFETVMHYIAQGAINISEGLTTIEPDSPIHRAMLALCEMTSAGLVRYTPSEYVPPRKRKR
jgi:hypothetical protein